MRVPAASLLETIPEVLLLSASADRGKLSILIDAPPGGSGEKLIKVSNNGVDTH